MSTLLPPPEPAEEDTRLTAYLYDLLEVGAKVAQSVGRQADRQARPDTRTPSVNVADQLERVSRAMRRTVLLIRHLAQSAPRRQPRSLQGPSAHAGIESRTSTNEPRETEPRQTETREAEPRERLDRLEPIENIANRPIQDTITAIHHGLGLGHRPCQRRRRHIKPRHRTTARPPDVQAPHGPEPSAPQSRRPPRDPDRQSQNWPNAPLCDAPCISSLNIHTARPGCLLARVERLATA